MRMMIMFVLAVICINIIIYACSVKNRVWHETDT